MVVSQNINSHGEQGHHEKDHDTERVFYVKIDDRYQERRNMNGLPTQFTEVGYLFTAVVRFTHVSFALIQLRRYAT